MDISYYTEMRKVERLAKCFTHRKNNLMEHQYMVAMLFQRFAKIEKIDYTLKDLNIVLHHDVVETVTADLSWDVKNFSIETKEAWEIIEESLVESHPQLEKFSDENIKKGLPPVKHALLKACDTLDLLIFIKEEQELGNKHPYIFEVEKNCRNNINVLPYNFPSIDKYILENYGK